MQSDIIKVNQRYYSHPRFDAAQYNNITISSDIFYRHEESELPFRDQVGVLENSPHNGFEAKLPTSLTYKISNELSTITSIQLSNHGAFLAVGTNMGMIRLYCFGRNHANNTLLQTLELNYEHSLLQDDPQAAHPIPSHLLPKDQNPSWQALIGKGIDITSFGTKLAHSPSSIITTPTQTLPTSTTTPPLVHDKQSDYIQDINFQVHELIHHQTAVTSVKFSTCLNFMLSVDIMGVVCLWSLTNEYSQAYRHAIDTIEPSTGTKTKKFSLSRNKDKNNNNSTPTQFSSTQSSTPNNNNNNNINNTNDRKLNDAINKPVLMYKWNSHPAASNTLHISPLGGYFAISHVSLGVSIYRTDLPDPVRMITPIPDQHPRPLLTPSNQIAWSPNGYYLAVAWEQGRVGIYAPFPIRPVDHNIQQQQQQQFETTLLPHRVLDTINVLKPSINSIITAMQFSPCGRFIFTADSTLTLILWDIDRENPVWIMSPRFCQYIDNNITPSNLSSTITTATTTKSLYQKPNQQALSLLPESTVTLTIPQQHLHPHKQSNQLLPSLPCTTSLPIYTPQPQMTTLHGTWPLTPNGTIHTDMITSCSFSYNTTSSYTQLYSADLNTDWTSNTHSSTQYCPYLIATTSLDGTTKIWSPTHFNNNIVGSTLVQATSALCDLNHSLLQTIYTKGNPTQLCTFTSRNLLMIISTDNNVDDVSSLLQAK